MEEEDDVPEVLYGYADLMIVGCIYYSGVAHRGEFVNLVREPNNRYDKNAIRVDNLTGTQVGHIKATQASCLARVLDRGSNAPRMEAVVSSGGTRIRSLPVRVHVYGPPEKANATVPALKGVSLKGGLTRQLGASSGGASSAGRAPRISVQTKAADSIKTQKELDEMFDKLDSDVPKKPTAETTSNVKAVLSSTLMAHQEQGLAWMVQREKNPDPTGLPPFWESRFEGGSRVFHNTITCSSTGRQPNSVHGGILADEMGLGKTLQVISLILANPPSGTDYASRVRAVEENQRQLEKLKEKMQEAPATVGTVEEVGGRGPTAIAAAETAPADAAKAAATSNEPTTEEMILATVKAYKKLKKGDLQASLKSKGLNDQGLKDELVTRLARSMTGLPPLEAVAKKPAAAGKVNSKGKGSAAAAGGGGSGGGGGAAGKGPLGTLVVCPMSVMGNWENQIQEHVKEGALKVYAYHGQSRSQDVDFLASCDVVVTTYDTLASDFNASGGEEAFSAAAAAASSQACRKRKRTHGLMSLGWHRVVLDEAHTIRNPKTGKHKACVALSARHRWCLTGTPLQNRPEDIGSLFTFLRLAPASTASVFKRAIGRPIQAGSKEGLTRLRVLMRSVCLRRNKRILGSNLPPKVVEVHSVEMDDSHREAYNVLYNSARAAFKAALAMGESEVMSQYASVLECLLRLRQVCCSRSMVPEGRLEQAHKVLNLVAKDGPKMRKEEARKLFDKLKGLLSQDEPAECAVCLEPVEAADARVLRGCGHGFCHKCLGNMCVVAGDGRGNSGRSNCPLCRATFTTADIMAGADLEKAGGGAGGQDGNGISNRAAAGGSAGVPALTACGSWAPMTRW